MWPNENANNKDHKRYSGTILTTYPLIFTILINILFKSTWLFNELSMRNNNHNLGNVDPYKHQKELPSFHTKLYCLNIWYRRFIFKNYMCGIT